MPSRRQFLQSVAQATTLVGFSSGFPRVLHAAIQSQAPTESNSILVVIQLTGGNDGLNTIIPFRDDDYYRNRFTLAIDRNDVLKANDDLGFHPSLASLKDWFEKGHVAVVNGVGYPSPNRSHFESMDLWHTAHRPQSPLREGWLGLTLAELDAMQTNHSPDRQNNLPGLHLGGEDNPLALASSRLQIPSARDLETFRLKQVANRNLKKQLSETINADLKTTSPLLAFVQANQKVAWQTSEEIERILHTSQNNSSFPATNLGSKLATVSRLIGAGLPTRVYYLTLDGFDTHANQAENHANLLKELSDGASSFLQEMSNRGELDRVTIFCFSEFGRRVKENASFGTDHGAAAPVFLCGGGIKGGFVGKYPSLVDLDDGDLKFAIDYRRVYAELLKNIFVMEPSKLLGDSFEPLNLFANS